MPYNALFGGKMSVLRFGEGIFHFFAVQRNYTFHNITVPFPPQFSLNKE
jgi:hypothetical protein